MAGKIRVDWKKVWSEAPTTWLQLKKDFSHSNPAQNLCHFEKSVYVIRLDGPFCVQYYRKSSPVLYIGSGHLQQRVTSHLEWINDLSKRLDDLAFELWVLKPRVRKAHDAYKSVEGRLLSDFVLEHGSLPYFNKNKKKENRVFDYDNIRNLRSAILIGSGKRFTWALTPMSREPTYNSYRKGFDVGEKHTKT